MYGVAVGLAGSSLLVSIVILWMISVVLRTTRRAKLAGDERLEILREQQERLQYLREERRGLEEELEWRRSVMDREESLLALPAPPESNGYSRTKQRRLRSWLGRMVGR
jgi:hypothetical protein